jgi:hypothetical protein
MTLATPAMAEVMTVQTTKYVPAAMDALEAAVREAGATVYARVDYAAEANWVEMELVPAQLLVFGNPVVDTTAMQSHSGGIDAAAARAGLFWSCLRVLTSKVHHLHLTEVFGKIFYVFGTLN